MSFSVPLLAGAFTRDVYRHCFLGYAKGEKSPLQKQVDNIAKKMDVNIPIKTVENDRWIWAAHGSVILGKGAITVPPQTFSVFGATIYNFSKSYNRESAILTHEIAHIKHNDGLWLGLVTIISMVAVRILYPCIFALGLPFLIAEPVLNIAALIPFHLCSVYQENQADDEALKYLNDYEKKAMIHFFESIRQSHLALRNSKDIPGWLQFVREFYISESGDTLLGRVTHPTLISRIDKIRKSLSQVTHTVRQSASAA